MLTIATISKHVKNGLNSINPQAAGYFGARLVTRYTLTAINPLAAAASFWTATLVNNLSTNILMSLVNFCKNRSTISFRRNFENNKYNIYSITYSTINIAASTLAFASGVATYAAISTLTTTHLIGINILAFAIEVATDRLL